MNGKSAVWIAVLTLALAGGCKHRKQAGTLADLSPPKNAPAWESRYAVAFDDSYTPTTVNMQGRAPNDVLDQQLFQARLGHAALVVLVRVEQVWGRGRYQGRQDQYLELDVAEVLLGSLPKDAPERLMLEVASIDELPGALKGETMLLFLRWDRESEPPFHHHLMPADDELVALIKAMVKHAQAEGVLDEDGDQVGKRGKRGKRKGGRGRKGRGRAGGDADAMPTDPGGPASTSGNTPGAGPSPAEPSAPAGGDLAPDELPPPSGPQPDASTGLDQLGGDGQPQPGDGGD